MESVIIATKNIGKAKEFEKLFLPKGLAVKTLLDYPEIEDVEETGTTFEENAILKAETIANNLGVRVIADDSGLEIDALEGRPGVYSARYAGSEKNDENNIDKVLEELQGVPERERTARFCCALAMAEPGKETVTVFGTCEGRILNERRGSNGFGYDPIFFVETEGKAMAELASDEKNKISHRANAIRKLDDLLKKLEDSHE
ncbi:XTP/dITP diphosphatase [Mesobacillus selenatarsenatis]|uniref:dITP/XTP pyrophosphatase n=1 Tax=Mesobacillus selenatarsenatis (strain DSM 18680 / JCM 14380 / FERM P-15431 / SF-1) TaxID=1321606 RepID=A0A0A8WWT2_MESS1|nr:XTP/dITP diphosphatase [Mesobacillus selenatarsenatis]GAM12120.1 nucleoside 5-triphosphatase RdgB (dHAPTP, dITP, XTP-specific) [Mesobacillus selenatarsenatis SF-1]